MKEEKSMIELVRRYEANPFSQWELFGIGALMLFFVTMAFAFFALPGLLS